MQGVYAYLELLKEIRENNGVFTPDKERKEEYKQILKSINDDSRERYIQIDKEAQNLLADAQHFVDWIEYYRIVTALGEIIKERFDNTDKSLALSIQLPKITETSRHDVLLLLKECQALLNASNKKAMLEVEKSMIDLNNKKKKPFFSLRSLIKHIA